MDIDSPRISLANSQTNANAVPAFTRRASKQAEGRTGCWGMHGKGGTRNCTICTEPCSSECSNGSRRQERKAMADQTHGRKRHAPNKSVYRHRLADIKHGRIHRGRPKHNAQFPLEWDATISNGTGPRKAIVNARHMSIGTVGANHPEPGAHTEIVAQSCTLHEAQRSQKTNWRRRVSG